MGIRTLYGAEICSGIGGLGLGISLALGGRYRTALHIEREVAACSILAARMEDKSLHAAPIWSDLWTFDAAPWAGRLDVIAAGIPCQAWSLAGRRRGHADERHLWAPTYRIVKTIRPSIFFLENVPGLVSGGGLEPICRDLCEMGYSVEAGIFSAAEVGAAHIRKRLFVLAHTNSMQIRPQSRWRVIGQGCSAAPIFASNGQQGLLANAKSAKRWARITSRRGIDQQDGSVHTRWQKAYGESASSGEDVADTQGAGQQACGGDTLRTEPRASGGPAACSSSPGSDVADASCNGWDQRRGRPMGTAAQTQTRQAQCPGSARTDLADANGHRCDQGRAQPALFVGRDGTNCVCLQNRPGAQPSMGGVVDGVPAGLDPYPWREGWEDGTPRTVLGEANRADRLRALGNAVVPQTAALAFATLAARAGVLF